MKLSKKVVLSVTALSALMCGSFDNSVEAAKSKADIIFGVAYYDEYMPYERLEKDMQMIKNANMNVIRIAESTWGTMEPSPGNFDFHHIDRVLAAAQKYDLQVVVGLPTYAIPAWMAKSHPEVLAVTPNGQYKFGMRQNMDITAPYYRERAEIMIRALMAHVKDNPQVIGYQLDNETKYYNVAGENVQAGFKKYLQNKFGTVEKMDEVYGLNYWSNRINTWDEFPDVVGTGLINGSLSAAFDEYRRSLVTDFLQWEADIVNEYKKPEQFVTQNFDYEWRGYSFGVQPDVDHFKASKCLTVAGVDIYHPTQSELTGHEIGFGGDISRSLLGKNYYVIETEAQGFPAWTPYPGQLRLQAFSHVASGADGISYWHWHSLHNAAESYWKGVLSHDLEVNPIYEEAATIGRDFNKWGDQIAHLKKNNKVAILVSNEALSASHKFPIGHTIWDETLPYNDVFRWIYDAMFNCNVECDILDPDTRDFSKYSLIVVPYLYSAPDSLLKSLDSYVKNGGNLVASFRTGVSDENVKIYQDTLPHALADCFGASYQLFTVPQNVTLTGNSAFEGQAVDNWMEMLVPKTAKVLARYNDKSNWGKYAAVTENNYGRGKAWYIGCHFSQSALENFIPTVLKSAGIYSSQNNLHFPIIQRSGVNQYGKNVYYFFNYSNDNQTLRYDYGKGKELTDDKQISSGTQLNLKAWVTEKLQKK